MGTRDYNLGDRLSPVRLNIVKRREFIGRATVGSLLLSARNEARQRADGSHLDRLACNSWPFRGYFNTPQMASYRDARLPLLIQADFPQFIADTFHIHNIEFLPQHFTDIEPSTINTVKAGLRKAKSKCCNLMGVEFAGGVFRHDADPGMLAREAERWVGVAIALECPSITIALTGEGPVEAHAAAHNLAMVVDAARHSGIKVLFHNDDLQRESAKTLTSVINELGPDGTGTCPDFGNFATKSADFALSQLRILAPYASNICHAKDGIAEKGKFYADDFRTSMRIMEQAGFKGLYSLEYEGLDTPLNGIRKLIDLVQRDSA